MTYNEETRLVAKAVIWMSIVAATPMIIVHLITILDPDFFWIVIPPL